MCENVYFKYQICRFDTDTKKKCQKMKHETTNQNTIISCFVFKFLYISSMSHGHEVRNIISRVAPFWQTFVVHAFTSWACPVDWSVAKISFPSKLWIFTVFFTLWNQLLHITTTFRQKYLSELRNRDGKPISTSETELWITWEIIARPNPKNFEKVWNQITLITSFINDGTTK